MTTQENNSILRGGQFLVKQTDCNDVFTPEDFSEQQQMMKQAVMEFNDREIIVHRSRFEAKDFALTEEVIEENYYRFSARLEVDYLNENYKFSLPEAEHYETLGGMIVNFTQGIPQAGETVVIGNYQIEIIEVSNTKIDLVCVKMCNPDT